MKTWMRRNAAYDNPTTRSGSAPWVCRARATRISATAAGRPQDGARLTTLPIRTSRAMTATEAGTYAARAATATTANVGRRARAGSAPQ